MCVCITRLDYRAVQIYVGTWRISEQFLASAYSLVIGINFYFIATQRRSILWVTSFLANFPSIDIIYPQKSWYGDNLVMEIKRIIADTKTDETLTTFPAKKAPREFLVWDLWGRILQEVGCEQNTRDLNHFWSKYADIFMFLQFFGNFLTPWVPNMTKSECSCPSWHCPWQGDDLIELTFRRCQWTLVGRSKNWVFIAKVIRQSLTPCKSDREPSGNGDGHW